MKKILASAVVSGLVLLMSTTVATADLSWPRPVNYTVIRGPEANATGNTWCVNQRRGSFGTAYFVQTESWVNYGGVCNGLWGRPYGYITAHAVSININGGAIRNSGEIWNAWNAHTVQADIQYVAADPGNPASGAFNYLAQSRSYNGYSWETDVLWEVP